MKKYLSAIIMAFASVALYADPYPARYEGLIPYSDAAQEKYALLRISTLIRYNPVILEAGAHYGIDTRKFATVWPDATILSFEPNPHAYEKLVQATQDLPAVTPINMALANYNGEALLHVCHGTTGDDDRFEGASSLLEASEGMKIHYGGPKVIVPCVVLDDWCEENGVDRIDFMWLDLEGFELQVLASSPNILRTVQVIFTETNFQQFRNGMTQYTELRAFLENAGFEMHCHWYREGLQGNAIFVRK